MPTHINPTNNKPERTTILCFVIALCGALVWVISGQVGVYLAYFAHVPTLKVFLWIAMVSAFNVAVLLAILFFVFILVSLLTKVKQEQESIERFLKHGTSFCLCVGFFLGFFRFV